MDNNCEVKNRLRKYFSLLLGKDEDGRILRLPKQVLCYEDMSDDSGELIFKRGEIYTLTIGYRGFEFCIDGIGCEFLFKDAKEWKSNFILKDDR